jgi:hypothetical protein
MIFQRQGKDSAREGTTKADLPLPQTLVKQILETLELVITQGVEIQLKVLQTLVSLLTTQTQVTVGGKTRLERLVQGEELAHVRFFPSFFLGDR